MASMNKVILLGNITRDVELKYATSGTAICTLGLAVNTRYGSGESQKDEVCYVDVTCFGRTAEVVSQYLEKGKPVLVEGRLQFRSWDGQDGQKHSKHTVVAERVEFLGQRESKAPASQRGTAPRQADARPAGDEPDDIPF